MAMHALECPSCGASLELDDEREFGFCTFCGAKVQLHEKTLVEVSGSVTLDESDKYGNFMNLANRAFAAGNMSEAYEYYTKAQEIRQDDYLPVFRKALCAGYLSDDLNLRIEEVVAGVTLAWSTTQDPEARRSMSEEIVTFALTDELKVAKSFGSPQECEEYVRCVFDRITLLDRLFPFVDPDNESRAKRYINTVLDHCKLLNMNAMQYLAGFSTGKGKTQQQYKLYHLPKSTLSGVAAVKSRMCEAYNRYIEPKIEAVKEEIGGIEKQQRALPEAVRVSDKLCRWWVSVIGVVLAFTIIGLIISIPLWAIQIVMLMIRNREDPEKNAVKLNRQLKEKKKELAGLKDQLKR